MVLRGTCLEREGIKVAVTAGNVPVPIYKRSKTVNGQPVIPDMPLSADEFGKGTAGPNGIESLLKAHPGTAYSLHEIEEALIGPGMNRTKHLDVFIADLALLAPLLFKEKKIEYRVIDGVPYFRWRG
jgi:hypothetical protein